MDYKFLNKVVNQIVYETRIDYGMEEIQFPFPSLPFLSFSSCLRLLSRSFPSSYFFDHCRDIYGLNDDEVKYVWKEYREIIKDKIKNNG